jgi:hypothetical protein
MSCQRVPRTDKLTLAEAFLMLPLGIALLSGAQGRAKPKRRYAFFRDVVTSGTTG